MKKHPPRFRVFFLILGFALMLLLLINRKGMETSCFVEQLGAGFNLGNTLDVHNLHYDTQDPAAFETYWGNPITTREMIADIKSAGFRLLRIPVTWDEHLDSQDRIDAAWLHRVQELVDYGLQEGLYVIINAHHDHWYIPDDAHLPKAKERMRNLWGQIATYFQEYDQRLLFESMNEPRLIGTNEEWTAGTPRAREIINELNEVFVRAVRAVGGNNESRYLLLPTYCAKPEEMALKDFRLPDGDRLIASVHVYSPYCFALDTAGTPVFCQQEPEDTRELDKIFRNLQRYFIRKGIPVIITEFGAVDKQNERERVAWVQYVRKKAEKLGIALAWWDAGPGEEAGKPSPIYDRYTREWLFPQLKKALTEPSH